MRTQTKKTQDSAKSKPVSSQKSSSPQYSHSVLQLQLMFGNQAVQRLCKECEQTQELKRKAQGYTNDSESAGLDTVAATLRQSGRPLDPTTRAFFEPRFAADFSSVRIHTDSHAAESARAINAKAYTVGSNVVFNNGQFAPQHDAGKRLLAHELTHVMQQSSNSSKSKTANSDVSRSKTPIVQRRLEVDPAASIPLPAGVAGPPMPLTLAVQGLLNDTCPSGGASIDRTTGAVTLGAGVCDWAGIPYRDNVRRADISPTPAGCGCLCDVVSNAQTTTIDFQAGGPSTAVPPGGAGFGGRAASTSVNIDPRFQGQYRINGRWVDVPFHLLFAHELCGHALPIMGGTHARPGPGPVGGTPPHERRAVDVEREIAAEGGNPRRPEDYSGTARQRP